MNKKEEDRKKDLRKFIDYFVRENLNYVFSDKSYNEYIEKYIQCTTPKATNRLNKLLDEFEEVLGKKFHHQTFCRRDDHFNNWVFRPDELKPHIKMLRKRNKEVELKKLKRELKLEEARIKRLEKQMKKDLRMSN